MANLTIIRIKEVRRVLQHAQGVAIVHSTGDVVILEPAVARLAAEIGAADRRPGDPIDEALAAGRCVGRL